MMVGSSHDFAHVMPTELSWHEQSCDLTGSLKSKLEQNEVFQNFNYELKNYLWTKLGDKR